MTNQINVIQLNNSPILYTKLVPSTTNRKGYLQYQQISKANEFHLIETTSIMGKTCRGVTIDSVFWFLVEDLIELNQSSKNRLALIEKLLSNISREHQGFIQCVDDRGDREYVLMVSTEGLKNKLFN